MSGFVRDHISLYAVVDVEFNSLSEDHQDLAPGHEFSESYRGSFKLILADKFPKKTHEVLGGNRQRSSIVMEC